MKNKSLTQYIDEQEKERPGFRKAVAKEHKKALKELEANERIETGILKSVNGKYIRGVQDTHKHLMRFLKFVRDSKKSSGLGEDDIVTAWIALCRELVKL